MALEHKCSILIQYGLHLQPPWQGRALLQRFYMLCQYEPKPTPKDTDIVLRDSLFPNDLVAAFYDALSVPSCRWMAPIKRGFAGLGNWIPELGKFLASFIFGELRLNFQCCG